MLVVLGPRQAMKKMKIWQMIFASASLFLIAHGHHEHPGFISIDCGAEEDHHDQYLGLSYETDGEFISSGVNYPVPSEAVSDDTLVQAKTLRAFPNGTRNCYKLTPQQGKGNKYLIRASFLYGNYDRWNQTPSFDLYIDVNYWSTIHEYSYVYKEIIYVPQRNDIYVCLVNTGNGNPFISTLELRLLDHDMYSNVDFGSVALTNSWRYNIGGGPGSYRHPSDIYDRIWEPHTYDNFVKMANESWVDWKTDDDTYGIPVEVLMTAGRTDNASTNLTVSWKPSGETWYIYFHLAEIQVLKTGQVREIGIYVMDQMVKTVLPEYGKSKTVSSKPMSCPFEMNFTLSASPLSNLPPILNAVEIMSTLDTKKIMTEEDDVEAVNNVKKAYTVTRDDWQGDPCSPSNLSWSGLNCTYDGTPRIISLNLSSSNLTGEVARALMDLTELTSLDLSHNQLTGQIPDLFDQMPKLKILNLSGNNLSGSIPQSLKKKQTAGTLLARFDGNPNLCRTDTCSGKVTASTRENGKHSTNLIIAISVSACVVILLGILATLWGIKRGQRQGVEASTGSGDGPLIVGIPKGRKETIFKYSEISAITNNFGTIIGQGGFGKVYLGILSCGTEVAVKISSRLSSHTYREFLAEVGLLMTVHHKNLVSLIGYCDETESMVLIYEFMSNGDLKQHLSENNAQVLGWSQRLSIAVDAAQGIEYLHNGCKPSIIHRDLKTTNILLNESMQAKIADFGLSKALTAEEDASQVSTRIAGTPGYLDPEFHSSGILTKKSDVYSFGIVLLELITGRPAIKKSPGISLYIIDWVTPLVERGDIQSIVDSRLRGQLKDSAAWKVVEIAMSCISPSSCKRPNMEGVLSDLKECLRLETGIGYDNYMDNSASLEMPSAELDMAPKPR